MGWAKRNLYFLAGAIAALLLLGLAGTYLYTKLQPDNHRNPDSGTNVADRGTLIKRYGLSIPAVEANASDPAPGKPSDNEVAAIRIKFRAVSLTQSTGRPEANKEIAYSVLNEIRNCPVFDSDPQETKVSKGLSGDEEPGTFTVNIVARLKHPMKVY
jgi:hypothetical protein